MVDIVKEPKEINGIFAVPKDNGKKQRLILDARRANMNFGEPAAPNMPHPGLFTQLKMDKKRSYG